VNALWVCVVPGSGLRRVLIFAAVLLAAVTAWACAARPAAAEYRHVAVTAEFGTDGTSASSFSSQINTLAYQQATHRLFVIEAAEGGHVYGFDHSAPGTFTPLGGAFPIPFAFFTFDSDVAVDNSATSTAGDLYVLPDGATFNSFTPSGTALPTVYSDENREICGAAVDNEGNIWVGRYGGSRVVEFAPGSPVAIRSIDVESTATGPCKVAVDQSNNDLYVSSYSGAGTWQFTASSNYTASKKITTGGNDRLAVNGAKHVIYVGGPGSEGKIRAFSTVTGDLLETIEPPLGTIRGLSVDEATDTLFVAITGTVNRVLEMPGAQAPKVTTGEPVSEGVVGGTVDPDGTGPITECYFQFGTTTEYGGKQNCAQALPINAPGAVSATLPGLAHETTYHYRLVIGNGNPAALVKGADKTFIIHNVSGLKTEAATSISRTAAQLNASFEGTNEATSYYFEYGTNGQYGSRFPVAPNEELVAPATGTVPLTVSISGLSVGTYYQARIVAKNSRGTSIGEPIEFRTRPSVNAVATEAPTDVTKTSATLNGSYDGVNNDLPPGPNEDVHYYFEWGQGGPYEHNTAAPPGVDGGVHAETVHVSAPISGLHASASNSALYHYRLVAVTNAGTTYGPDTSFSTLPPDKPSLSNVHAEAVQPTSATIAAEIATGGIAASYKVEFGTTPRFGRTTADLALLPAENPAPVGTPIDQLSPGTVYYYRLVASNETGTTVGEEETFATPDAPVLDLREISVGTDSAHLTFSVNSNSRPTEVRVEYGDSSSYGSTTAPIQVAPSLEEQSVSIDLTGLRAATEYHFRGLATNEIGTATGSDQTFSTQSPPIVAPPPVGGGGAKPCKLGFVERNGTCVPQQKKHAKHRKHKKKKHKHKRHAGKKKHSRPAQ
jgi:hypothetical protein